MPEYSQSTIHIRSPVSRKFSHSGSQWQGASAAGCASSAALHRRRLRHRRVIPLRQRRVQLAEHLQIFLDHREELEPEREPRPAPVQLPERRRRPPRRPRLAEERRRHRPPRDVPRQHQPARRIDVEHLRRHPRRRRRPRVHRLDLAVDIGLRPLAGDAQHQRLAARPHPIDPVGQPARAARPPRPPRTPGSSASPPAPRPPSPPPRFPSPPRHDYARPRPPSTASRRARASDRADKLDAVYAATSAAEIARTYDAWAATYDAEMAALGYRHPTICLALLARHLPPGGPVLDAGAGTGLLGEWLKLTGYAPVEGVDLSPGMLAVAAAQGRLRPPRAGRPHRPPPLRGRPLRRLRLRRRLHHRPRRRRGPRRAPPRRSAPAASSSSPSRTRPGTTASPPASTTLEAAGQGRPASTPPPPTARCPAAPATPRAAASSSAASDRGKIVDAPTAHGEPSSPGGREAPTMIRRILATTALAGALAAAAAPRRTRPTRSG